MKKIRAGLLAIATVGTVLAFAGTASAHQPNVKATCTELQVNLTDYEPGAQNNRVEILIDGGGYHSFEFDFFGSSFSKSFSWPETKNLHWSVSIDANIVSGDPTKWDTIIQGTQKPCRTPPTTTTIPVTTIPVPTTTVAPATTAPSSTSAATSSTSVGSVPDSSVVPTPSSTTSTVAPAVDSATTTSAVVAQDVGPRPAAPALPAQSTLPATGLGWVVILGAACVVLLVGVSLRRLARRSK